MFSHVTLGVADFDRALAFYDPVCAALGLTQSMNGTLLDARWASWRIAGAPRPLFAISDPFDGDFVPGNGNMLAFLAPDRATVDEVHAIGLANGGTDEGAPGLRPQYHAHYYGAYLRDPEGNKVAVACHDPV